MDSDYVDQDSDIDEAEANQPNDVLISQSIMDKQSKDGGKLDFSFDEKQDQQVFCQAD